MSGLEASHSMVSDLRGTSSIDAPVSVLVDPTGRRARRLRRVGRGVAFLFLLWIVVLILGGLGLIPAGNVPLGGVLRPSSGPPALSHHPTPLQPAPGDLLSARPLDERSTGAGSPPTSTLGNGHTRAPAKTPSSRPGRGGSPGHSGATTPATSGGTPGQTTTPGNSGSAPGHTTTTTPGNSGSAPGHTTTTTPGNSGSAPGHTTTTTPGNSGSAPGQTTVTPGSEGRGTKTTPTPNN